MRRKNTGAYDPFWLTASWWREPFLLVNTLLSVATSKRTEAVIHNCKPNLHSSIVGQKPVLIDGSQRITEGEHLKQLWATWM